MKSGSFSNLLDSVKNPDSKFKDIPVIAVTGEPNSITSNQKSKLNGILEKPFTPDELIKFIQTTLSWKTLIFDCITLSFKMKLDKFK